MKWFRKMSRGYALYYYKRMNWKRMPFYKDWKYYAAIANIILFLLNAYFLYSVNSKMAAFQRASMIPQLFMKLKGIDPYASSGNSLAAVVTLDSVYIKYNIYNIGNNAAMKVHLTKPFFSTNKEFFIEQPDTSETTTYSIIPAKDSMQHRAIARWDKVLPKDALKCGVLYLHLRVDYEDIIGLKHNSYFIRYITMKYAGDSIEAIVGEEDQAIK